MPYINLELNPTQYSSTNPQQTSQFYVGYSSINVNSLGDTRLYDLELVKQDLINQFNTRQGERVMLPTFGTIIWDAIFEPFTDNIKQAIADDIGRIINSDPRVVPIQIDINEQEYGILLELTLQAVGSNQTSNLTIAFNKELGLITQ